MVGPVNEADLVARGAAEFNAFEFHVRRNAAVLVSRIKREGGFDLYALAHLASRHAAGGEIERREMRTADRHAAQAAIDCIDSLGDGREARTMRLRIATLLDAVLLTVGRLPVASRSDAVYAVVAKAVRDMPLVPPSRPQPSRHEERPGP